MVKPLPGFYLAFFLIMGCDPFKVQTQKPEMSKFQKPVVFSFISPEDSHIVVYVDFSISPYEDIDSSTTTAVTGARVVISDEIKSLQLVLSVPGVYVGEQKELPIQHGKTYKLEVKTPNGFSVHSACTVPPKLRSEIRLANLTADTSHPNVFVYNADVKMVLGNNNPFYRVSMASRQIYLVRKIYTYNDSTGEYTSFLDSNQYVEYRKIYWNSSRNSELIAIDEIYSDSIKGKVFMNYFLDEGEIFGFDLVVSLLSVDFHYYNYFKSRETYLESNFFTEPTLIYSNIKGGYGCFGAYTAKQFVFNLK